MFFDIGTGKQIQTGNYPNGELYCKEYLGGKLLWKNPDINEIVLAVNLLNQYDELYLSFLPYGRSDRNFFINQKEPIVRTVLKMLSVYPEKKVYVMDPHCNLDQIIDDSMECEFYTYSCMPDLIDYASGYLNKEFVVVFPDETAKKRYGHLICGKFSWIEFAKKRDRDGNIISQYESSSDLSFGSYDNYLMVDDICSFGGTFLGVMNIIPAGNFYLACAHCEDNVISGKLIQDSRFKRVFTSDSIFSLSSPKVRVVYECERKI